MGAACGCGECAVSWGCLLDVGNQWRKDGARGDPRAAPTAGREVSPCAGVWTDGPLSRQVCGQSLPISIGLPCLTIQGPRPAVD